MSEQQVESMPAASVTNLGSFAFYTGMLLFTLAAVAPPGFYMLRTGGSVELIADYPALAELLGTRYGGDGITTFGLPPAEYALAGPNATHGLWSFAGEESHVLSEDELAPHDHPVIDPEHDHPVIDPEHAHPETVWTGSGATDGVFGDGDNDGSGRAIITSAAATGVQVGAAATGIQVGDAGGGAAHNNLQPTHRVNVIVKT